MFDNFIAPLRFINSFTELSLRKTKSPMATRLSILCSLGTMCKMFYSLIENLNRSNIACNLRAKSNSNFYFFLGVLLPKYINFLLSYCSPHDKSKASKCKPCMYKYLQVKRFDGYLTLQGV